jgi:transposase
VRYYLERRDPEFEPKMAEVLCVYREVEMRRTVPDGAAQEPAVAVISYDEKPGIQAIGTVAPDLRPVPGTHPTISRDHEYKRHGTVTLMAGIDLLTGQVHAFVKDRHRSREFIEFLNMLDAAYPAATAIKIILDNHSAHVSQETKAWLVTRLTDAFSSCSPPSTAPGSISLRGSSPKPPALCSVTSASAQNTSSNNASWSSSMISTATR